MKYFLKGKKNLEKIQKNFNLIKTYPETHKVIRILKKNPDYKLQF